MQILQMQSNHIIALRITYQFSPHNNSTRKCRVLYNEYMRRLRCSVTCPMSWNLYRMKYDLTSIPGDKNWYGRFSPLRMGDSAQIQHPGCMEMQWIVSEGIPWLPPEIKWRACCLSPTATGSHSYTYRISTVRHWGAQDWFQICVTLDKLFPCW